MNIEIWSDYACPFCFIGITKLERVLSSLPFKNEVNLIYKAYQLNPDAPQEPIDGLKALSDLKGVSEEEINGMYTQVLEHARTVDLHFNMKNIKYVNTFKAHRVAKASQLFNKEKEFSKELMTAYFIKGLNINDNETLKAIGANIGLDDQVIEEIILTEKYTDEVEADVLEANEIGIQGVPFFILDRKYAISGAQSEALFKKTIQQAYDEHEKNIELNQEEDLTCEDESCKV